MPVIIPPFEDRDRKVLCPQCGTPGQLELDPALAAPNNTTWYRCPNPKCPGAVQQQGPFRWYALAVE